MTDQTQATDTTATPRPGTTHPHLARERALKVLFAADVRGVDPRVLVDEVATHPADLALLDELEPDQDQVAGDVELRQELRRRQRLPLDDYTRALVSGVASRRPAIDEVLGQVADRWPVHRMPVVDRNLLRLAVYELAEEDTPNAVVIDEAVALAIAFAGEKARGFVNGVLETIRQQVVAGELVLRVEEPTPRPSAADEPDGPDGTDGTDEDASGSGPVDEGPDTSGDAASAGGTAAPTSSPADEQDVAAHEAYDLALGLLEGDEDLDTTPEGDLEVDPRPAEAEREDEAVGDDSVEDDAAEQLGLLDLDDEDDPLW